MNGIVFGNVGKAQHLGRSGISGISEWLALNTVVTELEPSCLPFSVFLGIHKSVLSFDGKMDATVPGLILLVPRRCWPCMFPSNALHCMFWDRISHWAWILLSQLGWFATEFHGFPMSGITHIISLSGLLCDSWGPRLRFSWLHNKHFTKWGISQAVQCHLNYVAQIIKTYLLFQIVVLGIFSFE